ncbi:MAG: outer membrane beta-barrel protein [Gammaproteobacteria bacterium]|nr:outer membrane beta-barrel protein [Gammaproteobacteria bacterium]
MKIKIGLSIAIVTTSLAINAFATTAGVYVGAQVGQSNTHNGAVNFPSFPGAATTVRVSPSNTGLGYRFLLGYDVTSYGGIEFGITHYAASTYKAPAGTACNNPAIREYGAEILGKGMVPVSVFSLIGKAGIAVIKSSKSGSLIMNSGGTTSCSSNQNTNSTTVRPAIGVGMSYDLTQNWVIDLSWMRVLKGGGLQNADLRSIGITYHFVDKYCGQFLC